MAYKYYSALNSIKISPIFIKNNPRECLIQTRQNQYSRGPPFLLTPNTPFKTGARKACRNFSFSKIQNSPFILHSSPPGLFPFCRTADLSSCPSMQPITIADRFSPVRDSHSTPHYIPLSLLQNSLSHTQQCLFSLDARADVAVHFRCCSDDVNFDFGRRAHVRVLKYSKYSVKVRFCSNNTFSKYLDLVSAETVITRTDNSSIYQNCVVIKLTDQVKNKIISKCNLPSTELCSPCPPGNCPIKFLFICPHMRPKTPKNRLKRFTQASTIDPRRSKPVYRPGDPLVHYEANNP
ncbi:hypothetical protein CEXT_669071 [Caerostris extrusa]|uniref:Uncharacterized protein n=1 Tax=Caerostris extrusa TaxID=172846 RepID=A0AAV4MBF8_CAEEX|nr:hypothetical protein CEXT_669071 [Caerostris extrusa]